MFLLPRSFDPMEFRYYLPRVSMRLKKTKTKKKGCCSQASYHQTLVLVGGKQ